MKYLAFEEHAVDEIVANRFLQSAEFEQGKALSDLISGGNPSSAISPRIRMIHATDGLFVTGLHALTSPRFIVVDLAQSEIFNGRRPSDCLFILQKLLRFAKKIWQGLALNFSERIFTGTNKAVLFPYNSYQQSPFRLTIDRDPWSERLSKRGHTGSYLLVYKAGHEGGDAAKEKPELINFRKAYESVIGVRKELEKSAPASGQTPNEIDQLQVADLSPGGFNPGSPHRPFTDWLHLLTTQQRRFVEDLIVGPHRVEGPAGTGKTLCLMLKAINDLNSARKSGVGRHLAFITHSDATKRTIADALTVIDPLNFQSADRDANLQTLKVCTLSELCAEELRQAISESEFIDRDAMESKGLQLLYINESLEAARRDDLPSHARFLTPHFLEFIQSEEVWKLSEMIQHEISVVIKGRAAEDLNRYKKLPPLKYGLPIKSSADKGYVYTVFRNYQKRLGEVGQFDTDDVVLTAIGQLDTPIWRRRRKREGFDAVFVDECHLFNINELHIFHYFTKEEGPYPIVYSIDRSQAVGDRGWTTDDISKALSNDENDSSHGKAERIKTIFRSSADIVNLAFSVVSAGATLFTNFDNPMDSAASSFTEAEERLTAPPVFLAVPNEESMIEAAFERAEELHRELGCKRGEILVVTLDEALLDLMSAYAKERNKAHVLLTKRGDSAVVEAANQSGQIVLAHADYVGGLEFAAVILVGVDDGRVPPTNMQENISSRNYLSYAAHNRLYVAISRAKYRVEILGEKARGPSRLLQPSIASNLLAVIDA